MSTRGRREKGPLLLALIAIVVGAPAMAVLVSVSLNGTPLGSSGSLGTAARAADVGADCVLRDGKPFAGALPSSVEASRAYGGEVACRAARARVRTATSERSRPAKRAVPRTARKRTTSRRTSSSARRSRSTSARTRRRAPASATAPAPAPPPAVIAPPPVVVPPPPPPPARTPPPPPAPRRTPPPPPPPAAQTFDDSG